jgi:hypothetical protein
MSFISGASSPPKPLERRLPRDSLAAVRVAEVEADTDMHGEGSDVRFLLPTSVDRVQERRKTFAPDLPFSQT